MLILCHRQALLSAVVKRARGFIKLRLALGTLHGALPDATSEEIQAYDDECAICRVIIEYCLVVMFKMLPTVSVIKHFHMVVNSGTNGQG